MKRVTGIGGIFIKSANPQRMRDWYQKHLGIDIEAWGGIGFSWKALTIRTASARRCGTSSKPRRVISIRARRTFMVNYRVDKLAAAARGAARRGLRCRSEDGRFRVRQIRLGDRSGRQQDRALGTARGAVSPARDLAPVFAGSIPEIYDKYLVPLIFEPYASDLAQRLARPAAHQRARNRGRHGRGHARLAMALPENVCIVATDLNQPMLDQAAAVGTQPAGGVASGGCDAAALRRRRVRRRRVPVRRDVLPGQGAALSRRRGACSGPAACSFSTSGTASRRTNSRMTVTEALARVFPDGPAAFHGAHATRLSRPLQRSRRDLATAGFLGTARDRDASRRAAVPRRRASPRSRTARARRCAARSRRAIHRGSMPRPRAAEAALAARFGLARG